MTEKTRAVEVSDQLPATRVSSETRVAAAAVIRDRFATDLEAQGELLEVLGLVEPEPAAPAKPPKVPAGACRDCGHPMFASGQGRCRRRACVEAKRSKKSGPGTHG